MTAGTLTMAWVLLSAGADPVNPSYIAHRSFEIPIRLDQARQTAIQQVLLFSCGKDGKRWEQVAAVSPKQHAFTFNAPADGAYLFKVAVLGGGTGGLTVAWELTRPEHRDRYAVTVYEQSGRLGGKGASGRNAGSGNHVLLSSAVVCVRS